MKSKQLCTMALLCLLVSAFSSCKDDANVPLRFYESKYEVPMGGIRYIGLESGNGNYSLEIKDTRIASAQQETGWTGGTAIYVNGILTGETELRVTDYATQESCVLGIKVVDSYENISLLHSSDSDQDPSTDILPDISDLFLINNPSKDVYLFTQEKAITVYDNGLRLAATGSYELEKKGDENAILTLHITESGATQATTHKFILWGTPYIIHRLDKNLNLNWDTPPLQDSSTRTSAVITTYTLEETDENTEEGEGNKISFSFSKKEMPAGILP